MDTQYFVVTPSAPWTFQESQNLRGRPATHLTHGERTLCGRDANGWLDQLHGAVTAEDIRRTWLPGDGLCQQCRRVFERKAPDCLSR